MWTILTIILVVIALVVILIVLYTVFSGMMTGVFFLSIYRSNLSEYGSKKIAYKKAIEFFARRTPFSVLTPDEIDNLSDVFSLSDDPMPIAQLFRKIDLERNAEILKDREYLKKLEDILNGI